MAAVIAYLFGGAAVFISLERQIRAEQNQLAIDSLRYKVDQLAAALRPIDRDVARRLLQDFLFGWENLTTKNDLTAADVFNGDTPREIWSFADAILLAYSVVTTIGERSAALLYHSQRRRFSSGYGVLTPSTLAGRLFCIGYGLLGVPLAMIAIANSGKFMVSQW